MPFLARLAAGAVKVLGFASRVGPSVAPTGLNANAQSATQINLSWTNTSSLYPIYIYRSGTSGQANATQGTFVTSVAATGTTYSNTGLTGSTTYYFAAAYFFITVGPYSVQATATTNACPAYGTYINQTCSGCDVYQNFHNGSCGTYSTLVESNSNTCGCGPQNLRGFNYGESGDCYTFNGQSLVVLYGNGYGTTSGNSGGQYWGYYYCSATAYVGPLSGTSYYGSIYGGYCFNAQYGVMGAGTRGSYSNCGNWGLSVGESCGYYSYGGYSFYYFP
jgi:hypothetical protein